ncbi:MAG: GAF and ANTAR domain-containing protein [Pseudonocardiaceae bacterium]
MSDHPEQLQESFAVLSGLLLDEETVESTLQQIAALPVRLLEHCDAVGVSLVANDHIETTVATDPFAQDVDELQYSTGEGPCLDSIRELAVVRIDSMVGERRWPTYVPQAAGKGVRSSLSLPLEVRGHALGALNCYSRRAHAFAATDLGLVRLFASHAAVALANSQIHARSVQLGTQLLEALESRDVIGQAKGVLMERHHQSADQTFEMLVRASQRHNKRMREIAQQVIDSALEQGDD